MDADADVDVDVVVAAAAAEIMTGPIVGVPFLLVPNLSSTEAVVIPISLDQGFSKFANAAAAAVHVDHCSSLEAPTLQVQHQSTLALLEIVVVDCSEVQKTVP